MKNRAILLFLALCLLLAGCAGQNIPEITQAEGPFDSPEPMPGFDAQNQYSLTPVVSFQETEDFFCGSNLVGNYLHYYDKTSGISGVLCADPACTHDSSGCSAYVQSGATLFYYDGQLYWLSTDPQGENKNDLYLWKGDLSRANREKVKRIGFQEVVLPYQPQQYFLHRGNLYIFGRADVVEGTKTGYRATLLSSPLDKIEEFTTIFDETYDKSVRLTARFAGNAVYYSVVTAPEEGSYHIRVAKYDVKTRSTEIVFEQTDMAETPGAIWVTEQAEVYLPGSGENGAWVWKLEDGKRTEVLSWQESEFSAPEIMDGIVVRTNRKDGKRIAEIRDLSGGTVYNGQLLPDEIPGLEGDPNTYNWMIVGGDGEKLIVNLSGFAEGGMTDHTVLLDIRNGMKATPLWSNEK